MEIVLQRGRSMDWEEFCTLPGPAIALDGFVSGPSRFTRTHMTFDYHGEDSSRMSTRTTAEQVFLALTGGCPLLQENYTVYVSDVNPGVALSLWMMINWENLPSEISADRLHDLVEIESVLDSSHGLHAGVSGGELSHFAWLFDAWVDLQMGRSDEPLDALEAMLARLDASITANVYGHRSLKETYNLIGRVGEVIVIEELHPFARAVLVTEGETLFVSTRKGVDGKQTIRFGALNPWACIDMEAVYRQLNTIEGVDLAWGGGSTIGGSPKLLDSSLDPMMVAGALSYASASQQPPL